MIQIDMHLSLLIVLQVLFSIQASRSLQQVNFRKTTMASCSRDSKAAKCEPCAGLDPTALMSLEDVQQRLAASKASPALAAWKLKQSTVEGKQVPLLSFEFIAKNFQAALDAIHAMGAIAEREQHHPDFHLVNYRNVEVNLWTHKLGGITENDILMAEMISDEVKILFSPKWLKENPAASSCSKES